jgi:hypothetical protein
MSFQERFKGKITTMPKEGITKLQIEKPDNSNKNSFNQPLNSSKKSYDS